jgi:hypothetical protein
MTLTRIGVTKLLTLAQVLPQRVLTSRGLRKKSRITALVPKKRVEIPKMGANISQVYTLYSLRKMVPTVRLLYGHVMIIVALDSNYNRQ